MGVLKMNATYEQTLKKKKEAADPLFQPLDTRIIPTDDLCEFPLSQRTLTKKEEKSESNKLLKGLTFYNLFWIFFIGSFVGVVVETAWCFIRFSHFESRQGLIYGPFNALYGFGALAITVGLYALRNRSDLFLFGGGFIIGSIFEYFCSYFQESVFGTLSWNYGNFPLSVNGRINLFYSVFWGLLALLWIKEIFPRLSKLIGKIPPKSKRRLPSCCLFLCA